MGRVKNEWNCYMTEENLMSFDEIRQREYEILCDVADFCDEHNLRYFLAYGTLLGAVRHSGFIPWDDDIDIMMPRPDYDKFLQIYNTYSDKRYKVIDGRNDRALVLFAKVYDENTLNVADWPDYRKKYPLGVDIDIFPIDGLSEDKEKNAALLKKIKIVNEIYDLCIKNPRETWWRRAIQKVVKIFGHKFWFGFNDRLARTYSYDDASTVGKILQNVLAFDDVNPKELFEKSIDMRFENRNFAVPVGYDEILRKRYGDYMQLPPENERCAPHTHNIYRKTQR